MTQLHIVCVLRFQVRIALAERQGIEEEDKRIEVLVVWTADPSAVRNRQRIFLVKCIAKESGWEKVEQVTVKGFSCYLFSLADGVLYTQTTLHRPLTDLPVGIHVGSIDVLRI